MADDKRHAFLIALLGGKKGDDKEAPAGDDEGSEDLRAASDEVFDAIKAGDKDAFYEAFKSYHDLCASEGD